MTMEKVVLFGAGGSGKEMIQLINRINQNEQMIDLVGFVDDTESKQGQTIYGIPVLGRTEWLEEHKSEVKCVVTLGHMDGRVAVCNRLEKLGVQFTNLIDPSVSIGLDVTIGYDCIINEGCQIPVHISIGNHVYLNSNISLGHDDVIGDCTICNPGISISGNCTIGKAVMIGGHSFIVEKAIVGDNAVIAPGSIVYGKVKENTHVMGNPARKIDL